MNVTESEMNVTEPEMNVTEPVMEEPVMEEPVMEETSPNFDSMTKVQLEEYGRTIGIELDRRKKKSDLIEEIKAAE